MPSKYKFYSHFVVKYTENTLKFQTKEDGIPPILVGLMIMILGCWTAGQALSWVSVAFMLVGFVGVLWGLQRYFTTWTFDRSSGLAVHRRPGLPEKTYALDQIIGVHLDSYQRGRSDGYRVVLEMPNSVWLPLCGYEMFDTQTEGLVALREFLGMEEE